ncbi:hypothetical protein EV363DRAFT_1309450 [Boletus edulis]|nr:hypothetical protein EV363DRAFT_1309450 [Boletus edulis]
MGSDSPTSPVRDPFDLSDSSYPALTGLSASQQHDSESSTYGELVHEIYKCGSKILRYHEDYLRTHSSAPPEESRQYEFVSMGDFLHAGRDFTVFAGHLFKDHNVSPSFPQKRRSERGYGDHKFVKPSSGSTAGSVSYMSASANPTTDTRVAVALKESVQSIHKDNNRPFVLGTFLKEIRVMGETKSCAHIVDLLGVVFVEAGPEVKPTLVVSLALGDLLDFFRSMASPIITWELKSHFAFHIVSALQALHEKRIVHADVKGRNVLIFPHESTQFCAKLSDFGNSTPTGAGSPIAAGTKYYLAPECLDSEGDDAGDLGKYGNSEYRDVYAFGLVVWEIATSCLRLPFSDVNSDDEITQMKLNGEAARYLLAHVPEDTPQYVRRTIADTLRVDPTQRAPLSAVSDQLLRKESGLASSAPTVQPASAGDNVPILQSQSSRGDSEASSLQRRLHEEALQSSNRNVDPKVFLAYCYILCSDNYQELREDAVRLLRQTARLDPFHLVPGAKLTPFRAMIELQDWEGLSDILTEAGDGRAELFSQCTPHIFSFGWRRFLFLACSAGAESPRGSPNADILRSSENVAVTTIQILVTAGIPSIGQVSWSSEGLTALHMASVSGKPRAVSALLANGADPGARDQDSRTPLHLCCQATQLSDDVSVQVARPFIEYQPSSVDDTMERTLYTPLRFAVEAEKPCLSRFLLENGADVNARAVEGSTALQECAWVAGENGNGRRDNGCKDEEKALELAKVLLKYGKVDINMRSCHNSVTALGIAAAHGNFSKMVSLLLDYGASPDTSVDDLTALSAAVQHNNQEMISVLLKRGADPNFSVRNVTPLGVAIGMDDHEAAPFLLDHGADPSVPHQGIPLVCWAVYASKQAGKDEVCPNLNLLLQRGASVTAIAQPTGTRSAGARGWCAVHFAALKLSTADLCVLVEHNALLSARTTLNETAFHIPLSYAMPKDSQDNGRQIAMLKELVRHGIELDATDAFGDTALHLASRRRRDDLRNYLLEAGCTPDLEDCSGRTAEQLYNLDEETIRVEDARRDLIVAILKKPLVLTYK